MIRSLVVVAALLSLGACATTSREPLRPNTPVAESNPAPTTSPDPRVLVINSATAMLGQPYRWGGAAPGGFDCSGLVVYSAAGAGLRVPRTAAEQLGFGVPITRAQLQAGDLIFMHLRRKELHVAIALDAEHFIHAPSSGGYVRIDSLSAVPYSQSFIAARRFIPNAAPTVSLALTP